MSEDKNSTTDSTTDSTTEANPPQSSQEPVSPASSGFDLGIVIDQAKQVVTQPGAFYRNMQKSGGYSEPLIFLLVMAIASGMVFAVLSIIGLTGAGFAGVGAIIVMPIALAIGGFISAAILFVVWKLMGSPNDYETAYRCLAYSTAIVPVVTIASVIPYLGTIVRVVWGTWLMIIASMEVHERTEKSSKLVFGILGAILLLTGLSGEYTQRNLQDAFSEQAKAFEDRAEAIERGAKSLENIGLNEDGELDPEKLGKAMGDFARAFEEAAKGSEESKPDSESK